MDKRTQLHVWYAFVAIFLVLLIQGWWRTARETELIPYSQFLSFVQEGKVDDIKVSDQFVRGSFKEPQDGKTQFVTTRVDPAVAQELAKSGVQFTGVAEDTFLRDLMSWVVPILIFFAIWAFVFRRFAEKQGFGGLMSVGRSRAKIYVEKQTKTSFADVAGVDEAKAELVEVVDFLKNPKEYGLLGARIPKGILLVGPPGTGKTMLAKAVAGEAGVPFFSISGSEFIEMFVGVGAARVRDLFEQARKAAPAIIFIDELDALGRARGAFPQAGGNDEREQTLNQLLSELDGFDPSEGVVLLGATNRPEILDPALLRAGRFDRQVLVDRPDKKGREQILAVHIKKIRTAPEVNLEQIASLTTGFSGADLANLVNEAALLATRRRAQAVAATDFTEAIERIVAGLEKRNRILNPKEREIVAHHEMGHALVGIALRRHRGRAQGLDHPPGRRCAGLHHPAPDRGPVPDDQAGAGEQDQGDPGRPCGREAGLRPSVDRGGRRSGPRHRHRPLDRGALRHGREARAGRLRHRAQPVPAARSRAGLSGAALQRGHGARDRPRRPATDRRGLRRNPRPAGRQPGAPGAERTRVAAGRDLRRAQAEGADRGASPTGGCGAGGRIVSV